MSTTMNSTAANSTATNETDDRPTGARRRTRRLAAVGLAVAGLGAAVLPTIGPASAVVVDTDHPLIKASHFDFGENWLINAPQLGGKLSWDNRSGTTYPELSGYLYLTKKECGRVTMQFYDTDPSGHVYLGESHSAKHCAPGNGKTQWWITLNKWGSTRVTEVDVRLEKPSSSGGWSLVAKTTKDMN